MSPPSRVLLLSGLCARLLRPRLDRRLTAGWTFLMAALVFLWTALDWQGLSAFLTHPSPQRAAGTALVALGGLAWLLRPLLRVLFYGPHLGWLWRQPLAPEAWSLALLPWLALAGLPLLGLPLLSEDPAPLARLLLWPLLWAPVAIAMAGPGGGWVALPPLGVAVGLLALVPAPVALPLAALWSVLATGRLYLWRVRTSPRVVWPTISRAPRTALGAVVQRDLRALLRTEPRALLWGSLPTLPAGALLARLIHRRTFAPDGLEDSAAVLLALGALGSGLGMSALSERLGEQLSPRQWPLSALARAAGLWLVALLLSSPAMAAVTAAAAAADHSLRMLPVLGTEWLALAAGAALLAHRVPRLERPYAMGNLLAWVSLAALLGARLWPGNLLLAAAGLALLTRRLHHR